MADIEKVIKGLTAHADGCGYRSYHCDDMECPYRYGDESCDIEEMCRDALELLKEREAIEPTLIREGRNKHYNDYVCPCCDNEVVYEQNYCSECGVRFLWKGR